MHDLHVDQAFLIAQDQRIYDSMRARLPSARAHLEKPTPAQSAATVPNGPALSLPLPDAAAEMERSEAEGEVTAGNDEPMDEQ